MQPALFSVNCGRRVEIFPHPIDKTGALCYNIPVKSIRKRRTIVMKRIRTLTNRTLKASAKNGGCGECQTSCQSACKTSCGVANQKCENKNNK